ncbi:Cof-type HAD-IIB family hydrolase [Actinospongicola halichondriae]|uniref:Cof-type HAD-IIB family hydrolase n=1 Tax=Actinospongicola halichondriae TaxID=3236844 RepID=UPI003D41A0E4
MPVRLVVSDLDGTLFGPDHQLTDRTCEAIAATAASGVRFVAATGRSHRTALPRLAPAPSIETICASNGSATWDVAAGAFTVTRCIADETLPVVVDILRSSFPTMAFGWESAAGFGWDPRWLEERHHSPEHADPAWEPGEFDPDRHRGLFKIMAWDTRLKMAELAAVVSAQMPDDVVCTTSGADFVEITGDGVDKASAVAAWCEAEGIDRSEVVAFGDQHNDITMLQWAGHGVAMGDAHPDVQAIADEIIGTNADDAVAAYLDQI